MAQVKRFWLHFSTPERVLLTTTAAAGLLVWAALVVTLLDTYGLSGIAHADLLSSGAEGSALASAPSATPVQVEAVPTAMPTPSDAGPITDTPSLTSTIVPTPQPPSALVPLSDDTLVFALLGIDEKQGAGVWRTDSLILAFVQVKAKRIALLSLPRDLWVYIPGHGYNRINTVDALGERAKHPGGGLGLLDETLRHNLGVSVRHYVRVDFQGFVDIVDALGGVTVYVEKPLTDQFPDPLSPTGQSRITLPVGSRHMDGHMALKYCRSRMTTDDFDRSYRQLQVLAALWKQAFTPRNIKQAPKLWKTLEEAFETDISMTDAVLLATLLQSVDRQDIRSQNLGFDTARPWTTSQGAQVLLPQREAIQRVILDLLAEPN